MDSTSYRVVALFVFFAGSVLGQSAKSITFTDNFSPGPSLLWTNSTGNWTASDGQYYAQQPNFSPLTYTALPFILTDFTLTVTTVIGDGGIWLRSNSSNPYGNYLLLILGGNNYGQGARGGIAGTSIYLTDAQDDLLREAYHVVTPGQTYKITVTARGDVYSVFLNDSIMPVFSYADSAIPYGQVGLYDDQPNIPAGGFGPPSTFSNFQLTGTPVPPQIAQISPNAGQPGTVVTIQGGNLQEATAVTFNGVTAQFTQSYPSTNIVATVPAGATTGPIEVVTPAGTAGVFTVLPSEKQ